VLDIDSSKEHSPQVALAPGWSQAEEYLWLAGAAALKIQIGSFQERGLIAVESHQYCYSKVARKHPHKEAVSELLPTRLGPFVGVSDNNAAGVH
jgi:hypothetical protein